MIQLDRSDRARQASWPDCQKEKEGTQRVFFVNLCALRGFVRKKNCRWKTKMLSLTKSQSKRRDTKWF